MTTGMLETETDNLFPTNVLKALLWIVGGVSILVGLYFVATDRLLLTAAVCFTGLLPAGLLAFAIQRQSPRLHGIAKLDRQRRNGLAIAVVGAAAIAVGGVLALVAPGNLSTVLLGMGPGMLLGGGMVYWVARAEIIKQKNRP